MHYKKKYNMRTDGGHGLISIDVNSLYPSVMAKGLFPIGEYTLMKEEQHVPEYLQQCLQEGRLFMAEVVVDARNIRHGILPYRTAEKTVIYPSGVFQGVYTSVDLQEALNEGYIIKQVVRGLYWNRSAHLFKKIINKLYNQRREYQKEGDDAMSYVIKILLNSFYGKMLETISTTIEFSDMEPDGPHFKLQNGQYQIRHKTNSYAQKPTQLGALWRI